MRRGVATKTERRPFHGPRIASLLSTAGLLIYSFIGLTGDLRTRPGLYLVLHALLVALMLTGWRVARRGDRRVLRIAWVAAVLFRLAAIPGEPALSDDVYRYVWDGRVQLHGIHPYRYAPDDPALAVLRDEQGSRINNPEIRTIYPPLAQLFFLALAALGAGPVGFKLVLGIVDLGVAIALAALMRRLEVPEDRILLYLWNPVVIVETAGSGHLEPLGVLFVVLTTIWILGRRPGLSMLALAGAIQTKIFPAVLLPGVVRRTRARWLALLVAAIAAIGLPYALTGPVVGEGLFAYAERWERNALVYAGVERLAEEVDTAAQLKPVIDRAKRRLGEDALPWDFLYRHVWPRDVARAVVGLLALVWVVWLSFRPRLGVAPEFLWTLGGVLLLAPTIHPWYFLWIAPFAVAVGSSGWLVLVLLAPLSYVEVGGDVPWTVRLLEFGPGIVLIVREGIRTLRRPRAPE